MSDSRHPDMTSMHELPPLPKDCSREHFGIEFVDVDVDAPAPAASDQPLPHAPWPTDACDKPGCAAQAWMILAFIAAAALYEPASYAVKTAIAFFGF